MIFRNISLKRFNTFGLDYSTDIFISFDSEEEAIEVIQSGSKFTETVLVLGEGSNLLFLSDYHGTIIHMTSGDINIEEGNSDYVIVSAGSGVKWDTFTEWAVSRGYGGIENLSLIPGLVGGAPVQNIGAYGAEVRETITKVRGIDISDGTLKEFSNNDCKFGYRDSIFKRELKGKYLITKVFFKLSKRPEFRIDYGSLRHETEKSGEISLRTIRDAVIKLRRNRLPDPDIIGNAGSFFKNPVVSRKIGEVLKGQYPHMPSYDDPSGEIKLAAGWMIEQCGWKGKRTGDAGVYDKQALVLINYGKASGKEIYDLSERIRESVFETYGIELEREVEIIGNV
jgi:UDP-N-acetylmuramate dehydrogenase